MNPLVQAYVDSMNARDRLANTRLKRDVCALTQEHYNLFRDDLEDYLEEHAEIVKSWDVYTMIAGALARITGHPASHSHICDRLIEITTMPEITMQALAILRQPMMTGHQMDRAMESVCKMTPSMRENLDILLARELRITLESSKERTALLLNMAQLVPR